MLRIRIHVGPVDPYADQETLLRIRIRIQSGHWILIRIRNPDPDPEPGRQK